MFGLVSGAHRLSVVILTIDLIKRDSEIILLLGCSEEETQTIFTFHKVNNVRALLLRIPMELENGNDT